MIGFNFLEFKMKRVNRIIFISSFRDNGRIRVYFFNPEYRDLFAIGRHTEFAAFTNVAETAINHFTFRMKRA